MSDPTVSVIIPTHNRRPLLEQCLETIYCQTYTDWEIVIVDDASEDDTAAWLAANAKDRFRFVTLEKNSGSTVTRNRGLAMAKGEFCLFFDDDDLLPDDALAKHIEAIGGRPDAIATLGTLFVFNDDGPCATVRPARSLTFHDKIWRDIVFWWGFMVGASLFRTKVLKDVGGFDESLFFYGDDIDLWLRIGHLGPVALLPDVVIKQRIHDQTRPEDFYKVLAEISDSRTELWDEERVAVARKIIAARVALDQVKLNRGSLGNVVRIPVMLAKALRCPYLLTSPLSAGEILRTLRRDIPFSWIKPLVQPFRR